MGKSVPQAERVKLVWENQHPGSSFVAQDIPLDLTAYKAVIVVYRNIDNTYGTRTAFFFIDAVNREIPMLYSESTQQTFIRPTRIEPTMVHFGGGQSIDQHSENNAALVPQKIYGVKF